MNHLRDETYHLNPSRHKEVYAVHKGRKLLKFETILIGFTDQNNC